MDYQKIVRYWSEIWKDLLNYAETVNWGFVGAVLFIILFCLFAYDSLTTSQMSIRFLLVLMAFIVAVYYFGGIMFGGMAPTSKGLN